MYMYIYIYYHVYTYKGFSLYHQKVTGNVAHLRPL